MANPVFGTTTMYVAARSDFPRSISRATSRTSASRESCSEWACTHQIEPNRQYAFRVPCSMSGTPVESGEPRLVVEVDEAIEVPHRQ